MDESARELLDQLEKVETEARTLGRLGAATLITFGTTVLTAHAEFKELVKGVVESVAFVSVVVTLFLLWEEALRFNLCEQLRIRAELKRLQNEYSLAGNGSETWRAVSFDGEGPVTEDVSSQRDRNASQAQAYEFLRRILRTKVQSQFAVLIFLERLAAVGIPLVIIGLFVTDTIDGGLDQAATTQGIGFADRECVDGTSLVLNGHGTYKGSVRSDGAPFDGALYLTERSDDSNNILAPGKPKMLVLRALRDLNKPRFVSKLVEGFAAACAAAAAQNVPCSLSKSYLKQITDTFPDVIRAGETIAFIYRSNQDLRIKIRRMDATFQNSNLTFAALAAFIGAGGPDPDFANALVPAAPPPAPAPPSAPPDPATAAVATDTTKATHFRLLPSSKSEGEEAAPRCR